MIKETFNELLNSDRVTKKTREVLLQREQEKEGEPNFLSADEFVLLQCVCDVLLAQEADNRMVDIAAKIDENLAKQLGPGWRYDKLPPAGGSYKIGLAGIDESALALFKNKFIDLSSEQKNTLLKTVREGNLPGETWKKLPAKLFFESILADATEIFYSHPAAQAEISYTGFADAKGWTVPQLYADK